MDTQPFSNGLKARFSELIQEYIKDIELGSPGPARDIIDLIHKDGIQHRYYQQLKASYNMFEALENVRYQTNQTYYDKKGKRWWLPPIKITVGEQFGNLVYYVRDIERQVIKKMSTYDDLFEELRKNAELSATYDELLSKVQSHPSSADRFKSDSYRIWFEKLCEDMSAPEQTEYTRAGISHAGRTLIRLELDYRS